MKKFEIVIFDFWSDIAYRRYIMEFDNYEKMEKWATQQCQDFMKKYDVDAVHWRYEEVC